MSETTTLKPPPSLGEVQALAEFMFTTAQLYDGSVKGVVVVLATEKGMKAASVATKGLDSAKFIPVLRRMADDLAHDATHGEEISLHE